MVSLHSHPKWQRQTLHCSLISYQSEGQEQHSPAGLEPLTGGGLVLVEGEVPGGQRLQVAAQ